MRSKRVFRRAVLLGFVGLLAAGALALRPVPIVSADRCEVAAGTVVEIREGTSGDVFFRLREDERRFYINRGLERGLELEGLRRDLLGEQVSLLYPPYWTPLDATGSTRPVSRLECGESVLFDETK